MIYPDSEIEKAKVNYSPVWSISNIVFTKAAVDILKVAADRVEVRRCILAGDKHGKLTVYVYKEDDKNKKYYYNFDNGAITYNNLSPNIDKFKEELKRQSNG